MAAPLVFPDVCRYKCGGHAGVNERKSPSANVCAFAGGDFLLKRNIVNDSVTQPQKISSRNFVPLQTNKLEFIRLMASPRHSSSKLGSALGSHINWNL